MRKCTVPYSWNPIRLPITIHYDSHSIKLFSFQSGFYLEHICYWHSSHLDQFYILSIISNVLILWTVSFLVRSDACNLYVAYGCMFHSVIASKSMAIVSLKPVLGWNHKMCNNMIRIVMRWCRATKRKHTGVIVSRIWFRFVRRAVHSAHYVPSVSGCGSYRRPTAWCLIYQHVLAFLALI